MDATGTELPVKVPVPKLEIPVGPVCPTVELDFDSGYGTDVDEGPFEGGTWLAPVPTTVPEVARVPEGNPVPVPVPAVEFEIGKGGSVDVSRGCALLKPDGLEGPPVLPPVVGPKVVVFGTG